MGLIASEETVVEVPDSAVHQARFLLNRPGKEKCDPTLDSKMKEWML
jgi:hypothetical protein